MAPSNIEIRALSSPLPSELDTNHLVTENVEAQVGSHWRCTMPEALICPRAMRGDVLIVSPTVCPTTRRRGGAIDVP